MRTVRYELLRPGEIREEQKRCPVAYLAIGPLEWHGLAMPFGTDPLAAEAVARLTAEKLGGVVLPTLFWGTERELKPEMLRSLGFEDTSKYVVGMDFPANILPSLYAREDVFALTVREYLRMLVKQDYKLIVILNGHGAPGQVATLDRLCAEFTGETGTKVIQLMCIEQKNEDDLTSGHATEFETSIQMYLNPDSVDLGKLPPKPQKLKNIEFGMADGPTFGGAGSEDKTVVYDPRDASGQAGEKYIRRAVEVVCERVVKEIGQLPKA